MSIMPRPYKLICGVQHYEWGTSDGRAYIPGLLGVAPESGKPYAELWIGAHPKLCSSVITKSGEVNLSEFITSDPEAVLGKKVVEKFGPKLPYLLKVLSINKALSIQTHPNKRKAAELFKTDPVNYPDDNHKPEIAIAINFLHAVVGIKSAAKIKETFEKYPSLKDTVSEGLFRKLVNADFEHEESIKKMFYTELMHAPQDVLEKVIKALVNEIKDKSEPDFIEKVFLNEFKNYGYDVGLISLLIYNYMFLERGESFYTEDGVPHAYLSGNIVECMANSDNVVRAGLTPKYKDIDTLLDIVDTKTSVPEILDGRKDTIYKYITPAKEFAITKYEKHPHPVTIMSNTKIKTILVVEGEVAVTTHNGSDIYGKGDAFIVPAITEYFTLTGSHDALFFMVDIP